MLTTLFLHERAPAMATSLDVVLSACDEHLLRDMGLSRDPANRVMRAPAEFYAFDAAKFEDRKAA